MTQTHFGACLCGKVRIEAQGRPKTVAACHCASCRKHTGAPVAVFVDYNIEQVRFPQSALFLFESSRGVRRGFCRDCGSTISYQADNLPEMIHIHVGVFDNPSVFTPTVNENAEGQAPWLKITCCVK